MITSETLQQASTCINGKWVPARPMNHQHRSLWKRLKEAFGVFRGQYDAFQWPENQ